MKAKWKKKKKSQTLEGDVFFRGHFSDSRHHRLDNHIRWKETPEGSETLGSHGANFGFNILGRKEGRKGG